MAMLDPDLYIKLFKLNDVQDTTDPENFVIIPARNTIFQTMFQSKSTEPAAMATDDQISFPEDGVAILLKFRIELQDLFLDCGDISEIAVVLWEDIACRLFERGCLVTGKQCTEKWDSLYAEYSELSQCNDESRILAWRHFAVFENAYKLRSKYVDSKIREDVTEYLNFKPNCPTFAKSSSSIENCATLFVEDFNSSSNEEDSQTLIEAINAAEKILEENLKESSEPKKKCEELKQTSKKYEDLRTVREENCLHVSSSECILSPEQKERNTTAEAKLEVTDNNGEERETSSGNQVFVRSEQVSFCWDTDSTQCFLDFRLYVEANRERKRDVLKKYKTVNAFVSQRMLWNGYQVSQVNCRRKWDQLMRYYRSQVKLIATRNTSRKHPETRQYFWQIDRVLRRSKLAADLKEIENFSWTSDSIKKLIGIRIPMETSFTLFKRYIILWQYVAAQMAKNNFFPTYNECSIKWTELREHYENCLESTTGSGDAAEITWNFYHDMHRGFVEQAKNAEHEHNYSALNVCTEVQHDPGRGWQENLAQVSASLVVTSESQTLSGNRTSDDDNGISSFNSHAQISQYMQQTPSEQGSCSGNVTTSESTMTYNTLTESEDESFPSSSNDLTLTPKNNSKLYSLLTKDNRGVKQVKIPGAESIECNDTYEVKESYEQHCDDDLGNNSKFNDTAGLVKTHGSESIIEEPEKNTEWTEAATLLLIKLRFNRELDFKKSSKITELQIWKELADDMRGAGHDVSDKSCANQWACLKATYMNKDMDSKKVISPNIIEELKLMQLCFTTDRTVTTGAKKANSPKVGHKFVWIDEAVRMLLRLRFSEHIKNEVEYGSLIAKEMQAAGYHNITSAECSSKWMRLYASYKRLLHQKARGKNIKWQYFEPINTYIQASMHNIVPQIESQNNKLPFFWTTNAVHKLIQIKSALENYSCKPDVTRSSILWSRVANAMVMGGFQVTKNECATQWNFLMAAYCRTKKELHNGNVAVIDKYFILLDQAMSKLKKLKPASSYFNDKSNENTQQPIDFSIAKAKSADVTSSSLTNTTDVDIRGKLGSSEISSSENQQHGQRVHQNVWNAKKSHPALNENVINLSLKNNPSSTQDVDKYGSSNEENESCIDSIKENVTCIGENHSKTLIATGCCVSKNMPPRILCTQKLCNEIPHDRRAINNFSTLNRPPLALCKNNISKQEWETNSVGNLEEGPISVANTAKNPSWSDAATHLLVDLLAQCEQKFPGVTETAILWNKVAAQMSMLGYNYTYSDCSSKWCCLQATYEQRIADMKTRQTVQDWPYFEKIDSMYKQLQKLYNRFRWILPQKRPHPDQEEDLLSNKKFVVSVIPLTVCNTAENEVLLTSTATLID